MTIDVLEQHIPGIKEHGIHTDAQIGLDAVNFYSLTGSQLTTVDTSAQFTVGSRGRDSAGNEYVYLKGVASVAAGTWVVFDELFETSLLTTTSVGAVAIAMAAVVASRWGWFQIYGSGSGVIGNEVSGDLRLYISSVTGSVDDLAVTGDLIHGAFSRSASAVTGSAITVQLNYPFVDQGAGSY